MKSYMQKVQQFLADEQGATAVEYGLMAALIAVVIVATVDTVGDRLDLTFQKIRDKLPAS